MQDCLLSKSNPNPNSNLHPNLNVLVTDPGGTNTLMFLVTNPDEFPNIPCSQPWGGQIH